MKVLVSHSLANTHAIDLLHAGSVAVVPTDTIYGIAARAADKRAVAKLYKVKHREGKPGTIIAASVEQLEELGLDAELLSRVAHLWPNPLSLVLPAGPELSYLHQGSNSLAVRIPKDSDMLAILQQTGPLLTSSANMPGEPPATTPSEAEAYFGDTVDFYVDGGDLSDREPSTVARITDDHTIEILRQGAAHIENKEL